MQVRKSFEVNRGLTDPQAIENAKEACVPPALESPAQLMGKHNANGSTCRCNLLCSPRVAVALLFSASNTRAQWRLTRVHEGALLSAVRGLGNYYVHEAQKVMKAQGYTNDGSVNELK
jgi:hypothetical protein